MALNKEKSIMGDFANITNHHPHWAAKKYYVALLVEFEFWKESAEKEIFFTRNEYDKLAEVEFDLKKLMKKGHLYTCKSGKSVYHYVRVKNLQGNDVVCKMSDFVCQRALKRAEKNPEDVRQRGFLRNLLD